jgi:hypothetical protein
MPLPDCRTASRRCKAGADDLRQSLPVRRRRPAKQRSTRSMAAVQPCTSKCLSSALALCWAACQPVWAGEESAPAPTVAPAHEATAGFGGPASIRTRRPRAHCSARKPSLLRSRPTRPSRIGCGTSTACPTAWITTCSTSMPTRASASRMRPAVCCASLAPGRCSTRHRHTPAGQTHLKIFRKQCVMMAKIEDHMI